MNRRQFALGLTGAAMARAQTPAEVQIQIDPSQLGRAIPGGFLGLGYEMSSVALGRMDGAQLVRDLGNDGVIRVGGDTSDVAAWAPGEQAIQALGDFLRATEWKLIWGLNLGSGTPEAAASQAALVAQAAGDRLLCFEIGNEPDLFGRGYGYAQYLADFRRFRTVVQSSVPGAVFAGPDTANAPDWLTAFAGDEGQSVAFLTEHYYRANAGDAAATVPGLLNADPRFDTMMQQLPQGTRLCEINSFSGGGKPGVSDTFAAAVWALDVMFRLAQAGGSGINWETGLNQLGFVSSYSPIFDDGQGNVSARPLYYAMLAFARAGRGRFADVQSNAGGTAFRCYATVEATGRLWVTLINRDLTRDVSALVRAPGSFHVGEVFPLTALATKARGIRLSAGVLEVEVRAASAAIVRLS